MIDIHAHFINEIDDGARSIEESMTIIKKLMKIGFTDLLATPHYITGSHFTSNDYEKQQKLKKIELALKKEKIPMQVYLGNEVFMDASILTLLKKGEISSLNRSRYILIELPVSRPMKDMMDFLFYLRNKDYVPIIAHPERYLYLQENKEMILDFLKMGCLFQGNFSNITGKYGTHAKKLFLYMLKNNYYQFLATDVHREDDVLFKNMKKVKKEIIKMTSKEKWNELTYENPMKVLQDEHIEVYLGED